MADWFSRLSEDEQARRKLFSHHFAPSYGAFRKLSLGNARHDSEHRKGFPPATVTTIGLLGVTYKGNPITHLPSSETRTLPGEYGWMDHPLPIRPRWSDFQIGGEPLFETCERYVAEAQKLIDRARAIAQEVHGSNELTLPESDA
jgi:hypothetical protein